jgi:hypothetical protein
MVHLCPSIQRVRHVREVLDALISPVLIEEAVREQDHSLVAENDHDAVLESIHCG